MRHQETQEASLGAMEHMLQFNGETLETFSKAYAATLHTGLRSGQAMLDLFNRRFQAYSDLQRELGECETATDVTEVQVHFFEAMIRDYADQAQSMTDVIGNGAHAALGEAEDEADAAPAARTPKKRAATPSKQAA